MDVAPSSPASAAFLEESGGARWAGVRQSVQTQAPAPQVTGSLIGLLCMAALGLIMVAHTAVALQPRVAPVRVAQPQPPVEPAAARPGAPRPEAVLPDPEVTDNGFIVQPWRWHETLTVSERTTLRASPGDEGSAARGTVQQGRPLRVIGLVAVSGSEAWLQVRTDNGGVAYVDAEDVIPLPEFRARERAAAAAAAAEARAEAEALNLQDALGAMLDVPPSEFAEPPPIAEPGELY